MFSGENFDFQDLVFKKCVFQLLAYVINSIPYCNWHTGIPRINNWRGALHNLLLFTTQATIIQMIKSNIVISLSIQIYVLNNIFTDYFSLFFFVKKDMHIYIILIM